MSVIRHSIESSSKNLVKKKNGRENETLSERIQRLKDEAVSDADFAYRLEVEGIQTRDIRAYKPDFRGTLPGRASGTEQSQGRSDLKLVAYKNNASMDPSAEALENAKIANSDPVGWDAFASQDQRSRNDTELAMASVRQDLSKDKANNPLNEANTDDGEPVKIMGIDLDDIEYGFEHFFGEGGGGGSFAANPHGGDPTASAEGADLRNPDADPFMEALRQQTSGKDADPKLIAFKEFLEKTGFKTMKSEDLAKYNDAVASLGPEKASMYKLGDANSSYQLGEGKDSKVAFVFGRYNPIQKMKLRASGLKIVELKEGSKEFDAVAKALVGENYNADDLKGKAVFISGGNKNSTNINAQRAYMTAPIKFDALKAYSSSFEQQERSTSLKRFLGFKRIMTLADQKRSKEAFNQDEYRDGQGYANLPDRSSAAGLSSNEWQRLVGVQGDQFLQNTGNDRAKAASSLAAVAKEYAQAGINDGALVGILMSKGLSPQDYKNNPEEVERYQRYLDAKSGNYGWQEMVTELGEKGVYNSEFQALMKISGIDKSDSGKYTENMFFENFMTLHNLGNNLHHYRDAGAQAFDFHDSTPRGGDHNGALYMNQGSMTGLAASEERPTLVLSAKDKDDMHRLIFRTTFIPSKDKIEAEGIDGFQYLAKALTPEEKEIISMLKNDNLSVEDRIQKFNDFLDKNDLVKNIGVANFMFKAHGWSGGMQLYDRGSLTSADRDTFALMGLAVSETVGVSRTQYQSCSCDEGTREGTFADVTNETMAKFAPAGVDVQIKAGDQIVWNGQGQNYQRVQSLNGTLLIEGKLTGANYRSTPGQNEHIRPEQQELLAKFTKDPRTGAVIPVAKAKSPGSIDSEADEMAQTVAGLGMDPEKLLKAS